jgi:hypothetical protein
VTALESGIESVVSRSLVLEQELARMAEAENKKAKANGTRAALVQGHDVTYWHQATVTLCDENAALKKELHTKSDAYRVLQENHIRLSAAHREMTAALTAANREIAMLRTDRELPITRPASVVPVNTQGKDAVFWHQCARTLQQQYLELEKELESKGSQCVTLADACKEKDAVIAGLRSDLETRVPAF